MTRSSKNISVVVPVLGNYVYTVGCIVSLMETSTLVDEVILIDNEENGDTAKKVLVNYPHVSIYKPTRNLGVAKSWDTGIKLAKNDLVAVINNDIKIVTKDWDKKVLAEWDQHPDAAVFCPWPIGREEEARENDNDVYEGLNGSFFVIDKKCLQLTDNYKTKNEYIDTNYEQAYWEDCDLLVQVRNTGLESYITPRVYVVHYGNKTAGPLLPSDKGMHNPYWRNLDYFNHKYNVHIWDYFKVYMSNIQDENTGVRMI